MTNYIFHIRTFYS